MATQPEQRRVHPVETASAASAVSEDVHPSQAAIAGHPIHPILVPLPIGAFIGLFLADLAFWLSAGDPFWARAGLWLAGSGVITGILAGALGAVDYAMVRRVRELPSGRLHAIGNAAALVLGVATWIPRMGDSVAVAGGWGFWVSLLIVAILGVTGWAGGEMSYRHRIGVVPRGG